MVSFFGDYEYGETVYIPFNTFTSDDPSASSTITNLAAGDIEIHKDGSTTQRASDAGVTVTINFDSVTGNHLVVIDTSENTDANFFIPGADYQVRMEGTTVDAATISAWIGTFSIENRSCAGRILATTIATLASQTSFTLTAGSADNDAYNGCTVIVTDRTTEEQKAVGLISDYTGATKTVTLAEDPGIFTMAQYDCIRIIASSAKANVRAVNGTLQTGNDNGADINAVLVDTNSLNDTKVPHTLNTTASGNIGIDWANVENPTTALDLSATDIQLCDTTTVVTDRVTANTDQIEGSDATDQINSACDASIVTYGLDHLVAASVAGGDVIDNSIVAKLVSSAGTADWDTYVNTTDALQALRDSTALATVCTEGRLAELDAANLPSNIDDILTDTGTTIPNQITALNNISTADVNTQVSDVLKTDVISEMAQGLPPITPTFEEAVMYLYMLLRNKFDITSTSKEVHNNAGTVICKKALSDDGTTYSEATAVSGA